MAIPSLFPLLMKGFGGGGFFVDDVQLSIEADPDITVDDDVVIVAQEIEDVAIAVDPDIDIEVET